MALRNAKCRLLSPNVKSHHRRRIHTEEKAKVVAAVLGGGATFFQFLAALAILSRTILSNHPGAIQPVLQIVQCKTASVARN